ncbi:hypothetical protein [Nitrosophilus alvini]|uniref:hypothetical protein n=1 Tax=Nitrosophilus alvini TaxID=2714855 RepID=UPI00190C1464|nr:hypothetical protein [Nitrosophilus alvini]
MDIKKRVLSLLIVCFSFFIVHDFVFDMIDSCQDCVVCQIEPKKQNLDVSCQIHADIHQIAFILENCNISLSDMEKEIIFSFSENYKFEFYSNIYHPPAA